MLRIPLVLLFAVAVQSQNPERRGLQSHFVSNDVVATWSFGAGSDGHDTLRILVLWRGTPGWAKGGGLGTSGMATNSSEFKHYLSVGAHVLAIEDDTRMPHARIDGEGVDLRTSNVFLIDRVNESSRPRALEAIWVDPNVPTDAPLETIIRREPALRTFLRCDSVPQTDVVGGMLCKRTLGP